MGGGELAAGLWDCQALRELVLPMRKGSEDRVELSLAAKENVGEIYFCLTLSITQDNDLPS